MNDHETTIEQIRAHFQKFADERDWNQYHTPKELAIGLTLEAAELLDPFRFQSEAQVREFLSREENVRKLSYELADVTWYVCLFANALGIDLAKAIEEKVRIAEKKYPKDIVRGRNLKYDQYEHYEEIRDELGGH
ncbi:MAG: nucleotide pyrophosphohydrolase [Planctomycetes bacterium]|nr:nucleotide pyrophosphohydrolase [Planctomycetota bacterium]